MTDIRVTVWNEFRHENENEFIGGLYPEGIHGAIAAGLREHGFTNVGTATLDEPEHGLTDEVLAQTDVLVWWGHKAHGDVQDGIVEKVHNRVLEGMGLIVLHSGHFSKIFRKLMGTSCSLRWREADEKERIWVVKPSHPIAQGLPPFFENDECEMYGELFDIPTPDDLVFISWFEGGNVFRSGCTFHRGNGKIFYFRPGHETYPMYHKPIIRQVIANAARWAAPAGGPAYPYTKEGSPRHIAINERESIEPIAPRDSKRARIG
jgi:trehalose utilization protein